MSTFSTQKIWKNKKEKENREASKSINYLTDMCWSCTCTRALGTGARVNQHPPVHRRGWMVHWQDSLFYPCAIPGWHFFPPFSALTSVFFATLFSSRPLPSFFFSRSKFFFGTLFSPHPSPSFFFAFETFPTHPPTTPHWPPLTYSSIYLN
jgi:hypothetical protein